MSRLKILEDSELSPDQRRVVADVVSGPRGKFIGGPFDIWLRSPGLLDRAQKLGEFLRYQTSLPARLSELAILTTARIWMAQFEWQTHEVIALRSGLSPQLVNDLRKGHPLSFDKPDEAVVYALCSELYRTKTVSVATYEVAVKVLGERQLVELVGLLGYYAMISMTLNVFDVDTPGAERPLRPLADP